MANMKIGFIGLGVMGKPMSKNLINAGYDLIVFDKVQASLKELADCGAIIADSLKTIAENCSFVITMLPDGKDVKNVILEPDGMIQWAKPGTLFIDMSSISPNDTYDISHALSVKDMRMIDAPVSGAYKGAVDGTLAIMVGGSEKDVSDAMPLLSVMGETITHIGNVGSGSTCKLCNQIMIASNLASVSESMMLAKKSGCDISKVFDAVKNGFAGSAVLNSEVPKILEHTFKPGFKIDLHLKDLKNVADAAQQYNAPIPITKMTTNMMKELSEDGYGSYDNSALALFYEKSAKMSYLEDLHDKSNNYVKDGKIPIIGIILGDHAGSGPELVAKLLLRKNNCYTAIIIGNKERFLLSAKAVSGASLLHLIDWDGKNRPNFRENPHEVYFYNIPVGHDIEFGQVTADSGKAQYDSICASIELEKAGLIEGMLMAPITKAAFHAAGYSFNTEFELFGRLYGTGLASSVVYTGTYFRSTVVGHCPFKDIASQISTERIVATAHRLINSMNYFLKPEECKIAIAALNPHAGEGGIFGDEESTIIKPAIDQLHEEGFQVEGPWPCDTALNRIKANQAKGIVYLYHDQGNIAQKAAEFGGLILIYVNIPGVIVSVGHGPAFGKAGKGTADPTNLIDSMQTLYQIVRKRINN